jgi:hypothetical protein
MAGLSSDQFVYGFKEEYHGRAQGGDPPGEDRGRQRQQNRACSIQPRCIHGMLLGKLYYVFKPIAVPDLIHISRTGQVELRMI